MLHKGTGRVEDLYLEVYTWFGLLITRGMNGTYIHVALCCICVSCETESL